VNSEGRTAQSTASTAPEASEDSTLGELVSRFPLAIALIGSDGRIVHSNARFATAIGTRGGVGVFG
jgi:hypothetical protein